MFFFPAEVLFGADYILQFYISRNKLDFLFSLMAFVDVVTLFPILVFKLVSLGSHLARRFLWIFFAYLRRYVFFFGGPKSFSGVWMFFWERWKDVVKTKSCQVVCIVLCKNDQASHFLALLGMGVRK